MSFLLNALCTNTEYTQNNARVINYTLNIADCFQPKQKEKRWFAPLPSHTKEANVRLSFRNSTVKQTEFHLAISYG